MHPIILFLLCCHSFSDQCSSSCFCKFPTILTFSSLNLFQRVSSTSLRYNLFILILTFLTYLVRPCVHLPVSLSPSKVPHPLTLALPLLSFRGLTHYCISPILLFFFMTYSLSLAITPTHAQTSTWTHTLSLFYNTTLTLTHGQGVPKWP